MTNQFQLTIDGNQATFEITHAPQEAVGGDRLEVDPGRPVLWVTTMRDGNKVWSGVGSQAVADGVPVISQFTTDQLIEVYRQARHRWYEAQLNPPSA